MIRAYASHEDYVAPARRRPALWRLLPASALIVAAYLLPILGLSTWLSVQYGQPVADAMIRRMLAGETPGGMLLLLWSFLGLALGPMAAVRIFHRRSAGTLIGPSPRSALRDFARVLLPILALEILLLPLALLGLEVRPGLGFLAFLGYLPLALPGILIQTGAEELVFRGYLQQQLAARFRSPLIWIGIPSVLFAWGHYLPEDFGPNAWLVALWAAVFGLLAADLTARTGTLGAALGFHAANNISALLIVGLAGNLDGLALWTVIFDPADPDAARPALLLDFASMVIAWLVARISLRV
ncbi:CPBP family intramembrane metalloprotease [Defluviimonas sp. WL0024]|uniref:CPBP family intramembrane metalloprotease n=2 Tax=Albidovulum TaxID=205889 RepID=A0ABT3IZ55_9RHOB|nr:MULTISPECIES: CPBP family intramembrane glutamic endopeptidase [Defluviimonas]MCU9848295.1 CPBP family intramembrane metalloprotease [Defluviimonas sp. WL0024]MCW3780719.1 CPBP family intramembrane metalloprotease [Defluviimonas salinarum]